MTSRPCVSRSSLRGTKPIGVSAAPALPSQRSAIQRRTRRFSPKPGHMKRPFLSCRNQLTWKIFGSFFAAAGERQPVRPVVAEVVAAERLHRHRVATHDAHLSDRRGRGFGRHAGAHEHAVGPVARLVHERRHFAAAAAEQDRGDRHTFRGVGERRVDRILFAETVKREFGCAAGPLPGVYGRPCQSSTGVAAVEPLPPRLIISRDRDVREDRVVLDHVVGVVVRLAVRARHDAEVAGLRIDRAELAVLADVQPADVVADRPHFPARHRCRRHQHRKVGLAAGGRERRSDVVRASFGL